MEHIPFADYAVVRIAFCNATGGSIAKGPIEGKQKVRQTSNPVVALKFIVNQI